MCWQSPSKTPHYLIKAVYQPRVLAYGLAILICVSQALSHSEYYSTRVIWTTVIFLLVYPHFSFYFCLLWFNTDIAARKSLLIDAGITGCLIAWCGLSPLVIVYFVTALSISTLIIDRPSHLFLNLCLSLFAAITSGTVSVVFLENNSIVLETTRLTEIVGMFSLFFYVSVVAWMGFRVTSKMGYTNKQAIRQRENLSQLTRHLKQYVGNQVFDSIKSDLVIAPFPDTTTGVSSVKKTQRKRLTIFFSDIEGFTRLMDTQEEDSVTKILNEYLNAMAKIANSFGGTIDKFMGDGIMIFFGDPQSKGAKVDALQCVYMAIEMRHELVRLRKNWAATGVFSDLHIRIGIHTGYCAVGNFGCDEKMDYTAIGGAVNIASRLESKANRDDILISSITHSLVRNQILCTGQSPLKLKGIKAFVDSYRVVTNEKLVQEPVIKLCQQGLRFEIDPACVDLETVNRSVEQVLEEYKTIMKER